jgi:hypothetical protein
MQDLLTWGAIIAAGGSVVTVVKFWMDMGAAHAKAEAAASAAAIAAAKTDLLANALNGFKVEAAQTYATSKALEATEASLVRGVENSVQGVYSRLDAMTQRLDSLITIANRADRH